MSKILTWKKALLFMAMLALSTLFATPTNAQCSVVTISKKGDTTVKTLPGYMYLRQAKRYDAVAINLIIFCPKVSKIGKTIILEANVTSSSLLAPAITLRFYAGESEIYQHQLIYKAKLAIDDVKMHSGRYQIALDNASIAALRNSEITKVMFSVKDRQIELTPANARFMIDQLKCLGLSVTAQ